LKYPQDGKGVDEEQTNDGDASGPGFTLQLLALQFHNPFPRCGVSAAIPIAV